MDSQAELMREYRLTYFVNFGRDNEIELFDLKKHKLFLKRVATDIPRKQLFLGSKITIYARQMTITEFADPTTAAAFKTGVTCGVVGGCFGSNARELGRILGEIEVCVLAGRCFAQNAVTSLLNPLFCGAAPPALFRMTCGYDIRRPVLSICPVCVRCV
jgi:hypothetical protein